MRNWMTNRKIVTVAAVALLGACATVRAQVYSPHVTKVGQTDTTDMKKLAQDIYKKYNAHTPREKAEAVWRFYLTDGRFVKPGMFYHLAGWAYEEPLGQVLDPIKLLNSYGYGLCYQDAPLLEATYEAGGFKSARVWFLTGHTVAEVFYDGAYHYYDSDMLGYNPVGTGPLKQRDVASVYQIEHNGNIILKNVTGPKTSNPKSVDYPWYPADVHANAMGDLAQIFTSTKDNYLYAYRRYPEGHSLDFVLRPGETMVRYFHPASADLFYLPYEFNGKQWQVLPDFAQFNMKISKGPHSEKDYRSWATGTIEYRPPAGVVSGVTVRYRHSVSYTFSMPSPYVIIDAAFAMQASLPDAKDRLTAETSVDGGHTWTQSASLAGPFQGLWKTQPARLPAAHGDRNAVSGTYVYLVRFSMHSASKHPAVLHDPLLTTMFQLNPRSLPTLTAGQNHLEFATASTARTELPVAAAQFKRFASKVKNASYLDQAGQGYIINRDSKPGVITFTVADAENRDLSGVDVGGRFLDLRDGIAPDKFTAEVRKVTPWPTHAKGPGTASIAWATSSKGPWTVVWTYDPKLSWLDGQPIRQVLRWPEVDRSVRNLPVGTKLVYVRYSFNGMAIDDFRLASIRPANPDASDHLVITQVWKENGVEHQFRKDFPHAASVQSYDIAIPDQAAVTNEALILECPAVIAAAK